LVDKKDPAEFTGYVIKALPVLDYAPIMVISAKEGFNCSKIFELAHSLHKQAGLKISTSQLNQVIEYIKRENPPPSRGTKLPKIFYATQIQTHPQKILIFVNDKELFGENYKRYIIRKLREKLPISEVPIILEFRNRPKVFLRNKKA
jgi:GTP-binding protein